MKNPVIISFLLLMGISSLVAQTTGKSGMVKDIENHYYKTVIIGNYEWMAENLKTSTYNDSSKITCVDESTEWTSLRSSACCIYDNNHNKADSFGILYNWYVISTGKLCPEGWRVPTDDEWKYLEGFADTRYGTGDSLWNNTGLRGYNAGRQLKTSSGWYEGMSGTDELGFSALPGGERLSRNGRFYINGRNGFWWSSTENDTSNAWYRSIIYAYDQILRGYHDKRFGFSVRCIRDKK